MIREKILGLVNEVRLNFCFACRRFGVPGYSIHQIRLPEENLIYIPIPKNATSSIKHALYEIEFDRQFNYEHYKKFGCRDIHNYYKKRSNAFTGTTVLENEKQADVFIVIRDPVKRLISCYRNRVVDLGDLTKTKREIKNRGLLLEPDLNTFVMQLEEYREANKIIEHHSRPQYRFLGNTLSYIDKIYPIAELKELKKMLQGYKSNLQMRSEKSGGTSFGLKDLSEEALERVLVLYQNDYELLKEYYSPEKIRKEYKEKRSKQ
jgi:hypothetical protein